MEMKRQPRRTPRAPLPPAERHRRSREALIRRTLALAVEGVSLAGIARRAHMPRRSTLERWLAEDGALRAAYDAACRLAPEVMADDVVALADSVAPGPRLRARIAAARLKIEARKWWLEVREIPYNWHHSNSNGVSVPITPKHSRL